MHQRPGGLYGALEDVPLIAQKGHWRRIELLERLDIGDVRAMTIVDFGMGSWGIGSVFAKLQNAARAIGMDISRAAIEQSRTLIAESKAAYRDQFEAYQSDGMHIPLKDNSVDLFFSGESIEHVKFPPRFLSEIYRVLNDSGQLIITTPNRDAIKYKESGEEYCTSAEHFWLFNWPELRRTVCEFFDIKVAHGFNGSFGRIEDDQGEKDDEKCESWSKEFLDEPENATGIVLHLIKKQNVTHRYEIQDIPLEQLSLDNVKSGLALEFGLKGLLLEERNSAIVVTRPPSDGIVCRFWCHAWSGAAIVTAGRTLDRIDLYARWPGWRNWTNGEATYEQTQIRIAPAGTKNEKALLNQVIFLEAFTWRRILAAGVPDARLKPTLPQVSGYGFDHFQFFVGTTVFLWFSPTGGNLGGAWQPLGGRRSWSGRSEFWQRQIREMMMANIDAIYLHCISDFREQRREFFAAYARLRADGWDVPKIAPCLDPFFLWREAPINARAKSDKDKIAQCYIEFYEDYLRENQDDKSAGFLLTIDGKLALATWWVAAMIRNVSELSRDDLHKRLRAALADKIGQVETGIYMMSAALIDPDLNFSDERMVMFAGYAYAIHSVHNGIDVWHVQPGYWDQNIRVPGFHLPRSGGTHYKAAWDAVYANKQFVHRVYVESWNEYDEGSGIYAAEPSDVHVNTTLQSNSDTFSLTQDPYEYIQTTANGASRLNGRREYDATINFLDLPQTARPGEIIQVSLAVRNLGNARWKRRDEIGIAATVGSEDIAITPLDRGCNPGPVDHVGIVRGQACIVSFHLTMPQQKGRTQIECVMANGIEAFGQSAVSDIQVD